MVLASFSDYFSFELMWSRIPKLLEKIPITLELAGLAFLVSLILGLLIAVVRFNPRSLNTSSAAFLSSGSIRIEILFTDILHLASFKICIAMYRQCNAGFGTFGCNLWQIENQGLKMRLLSKN